MWNLQVIFGPLPDMLERDQVRYLVHICLIFSYNKGHRPEISVFVEILDLQRHCHKLRQFKNLPIPTCERYNPDLRYSAMAANVDVQRYDWP